MSVGASYLAKIKAAAGISGSTYDTDITDLIESARSEMIRIGIGSGYANSETDSLIRRAIRTLVQSEYAENEGEAKRLSESFAAQIAALSQSDGYHEDAGEVIEDAV